MISENPHREPVGEDCRSRRFRCGSARDELESNVGTIHLGTFRFPSVARPASFFPPHECQTRPIRDPGCEVLPSSQRKGCRSVPKQPEADGAELRFARILKSGPKKPL